MFATIRHHFQHRLLFIASFTLLLNLSSLQSNDLDTLGKTLSSSIINGEKKGNPQLLKGVIWEDTQVESIDSLINNIQLDNNNKIILIDCSLGPKSKSNIYSLKNKCKSEDGAINHLVKIKKIKRLKRKNYVKLFLYNLNPYLHKVGVEINHKDYEFGKGALMDQVSKDNNGQLTKNTNDPTPQINLEEILQHYISTADSLQYFIDRVKTDPTPSSLLLEKNKEKIQSNYSLSNLYTVEELIKFAKDNTLFIEDADIKKIKNIPILIAEIKTLTYTMNITLLPIQIQSYDELTIELTLKDQNNALIGKPHTYIYPISGGIGINQSYGFAGHGLQDESYTLKDHLFQDTTFATYQNGEIIQTLTQNGLARDSIQSISPVNRKEIIRDEHETKITMTVSTITHIYFRMGEFSIGPHLGLATDIFQDLNLRYMTGLSLLYSDGRNRLSLNAGYLMGKRKVLSNTLSLGDFIDSSISSVPMFDAQASTLYVGISYNIPLNQKQSE